MMAGLVWINPLVLPGQIHQEKSTYWIFANFLNKDYK
jgi:hypothetical protein